MDILHYYQSAEEAAKSPILLQFREPITNAKLDICGIEPTCTLEVRNGRLLKDGKDSGEALAIFDHLVLESSSSFFPAYLGFFSYEFAEHLGKPCHKASRTLPDAFFRCYERGLVIKDQKLIHYDPIPSSTKDAPNFDARAQDLKPSITQSEFFDVVARIKEKIRQGIVYQVNFSLPFFFDASNIHPQALYTTMRLTNESPFMGIVCDRRWSLICGSPERLFSLKDSLITARPIAGTKKRGADDTQEKAQLLDLSTCIKESAEHAMLVDLMRNDLNRIANPETVQVEEDRTVEFYSHVMHLVSELRAKSQKSLKDIMSSIFPGGTITGAPKKSVMEAIAELEAGARGPYTGSFGYISSGFGVDLNIVIRSVIKAGNQAWINTGAGIVIDSDAEREWEEVHKKASALKDVLAQRSEAKKPRPSIKGPKLINPIVSRHFDHCRVLFVENEDSFSFNIIDALRGLGAHVELATHNDQSLEGWSHVVIGPGPGNPSAMPTLGLMIERTLNAGLPLLGICLGHQALGHFFGAAVKAMPAPVHGKSHAIYHQSTGLFAGLSEPSRFTRYHSLAIDSAPAGFIVDAYSSDDQIMAIRHQSLPLFGVQFHPESYLSHEGNLLLSNFLRIDCV